MYPWLQARADPDHSSLFHHTLGAWTHAYIPPHLPETFPSPTNRERSSACLRAECAWRPTAQSLSAGIGGNRIIGRSTLVFHVQQSTLFARNSRSLKATRRLEIADSASGLAQRYHCSVQLGVPKIPVPTFVQYCQLSRMSTSRARKISLLPSL